MANIDLADYDEKSKKITAFKMLVQKLPKANWTLIRSLSEFLIGIVNNSEINKMSIRNVGIVFSPTLNIPSPVFSMFLTDFGSIFGDEYEEPPAPALEISITEPLTPEDIRSPRHQIFSNLPTPSYNQETFSKNQLSQEHATHNSRVEHDVGFIPLQPSYEQPSYEPPSSRIPTHDQVQRTSIVPGPEYGLGSRKSGVNSAAKARRRESSMLLMGNHQKKSSLPALTGEPGESSVICIKKQTKANDQRYGA